MLQQQPRWPPGGAAAKTSEGRIFYTLGMHVHLWVISKPTATRSNDTMESLLQQKAATNRSQNTEQSVGQAYALL